jgi:alkylation response protein AidB-like acyl-CoA dehydrogenase
MGTANLPPTQKTPVRMNFNFGAKDERLRDGVRAFLRTELTNDLTRAGAPSVLNQGASLLAPARAYANDALKAHYLPHILFKHYRYPGFSEPGSGSDLASLKTRAVRDGDDHVSNRSARSG